MNRDQSPIPWGASNRSAAYDSRIETSETSNRRRRSRRLELQGQTRNLITASSTMRNSPSLPHKTIYQREPNLNNSIVHRESNYALNSLAIQRRRDRHAVSNHLSYLDQFQRGIFAFISHCTD